MDLSSQIITLLKQWPGKTIDVFAIQSGLGGDFEWEELETVVGRLLADKILIASSKKTAHISASSRFRIDKTVLYQAELALVRRMELQLDSRICLKHYYKHPEEMEGDMELLRKIHHSIQNESIFEESYMPELSLRLVGDEKWIEYKEGKKFLKKIGLWECFALGSGYEPIAFALNPAIIADLPKCGLVTGKETSQVYRHLIVENKTTFKQILRILKQTDFTTVIYGQGYKIISSCRMLKEQLPLNGKHQFEYFGDFDKKGIEIFDTLTGQIEVSLHQGLYEALLKKSAVRGHENQNCAKEKIERFCSHFPNAEEQMLLLENGYYLPQEMLSEQEMEAILKK